MNRLGRAKRWAGALAVLATSLGWAVAENASSSHQRALIPTTLGLVVARRKRRRDSDAEDESTPGVQPSHPVTKFLWGAVNSGEYADVDLHIHPDLAIYLNGHRFGPQDLGGQGTIALAETLEFWRDAVPDLHWTLHDEVVSKDRQTVAVRFTASGTHTGRVTDVEPTGNRLSYEVTLFLHVTDGKLREIHQTVDLHEVLIMLGLEHS